MNNKRIVCILSGGMDSTVLIYDLVKSGFEVNALSFNYGQRHIKELEMAKKTCQNLGIPHKVVDLSNLNEILQGSSLTSSNIATPHGKYDEESMKATVVPNRNMIMLSIAAGYAISIKATSLYYGAHAGDHTIYPDCRPEFITQCRKTILLADWHNVRLEAPYSNMDKGDIVTRGKDLNVPFENTWTCYEGGAIPCGKCGACQEREEAFKKAGIRDPSIPVKMTILEYIQEYFERNEKGSYNKILHNIYELHQDFNKEDKSVLRHLSALCINVKQDSNIEFMNTLHNSKFLFKLGKGDTAEYIRVDVMEKLTKQYINKKGE